MFQDSQIGTTAPKRSSRSKEGGAAPRSRLKAVASKRSSRGKNNHAETQVIGERFTPLLSRETYTFSRMRIDRGGPRSCTAICFPGWVRA